MFFLSLFLVSISSVDYVNDTTPITINKNGESNYEIDIGAEGVEFTLVTTKMLSFKGIQSDKSKLINIILNFHDDDYHNIPFSLTTENVRITFACDDPIRFSLSSLTSTNTDFSSEKPIYANITTNSNLEFDYTSFVNGFGPGCTLAGSKTGEGLYSEYNSLLQVQLPDTVKEVTFLDTSFKVELESGEKDTFSNVFNQNYQIVLLSNEDKDEVVIDASSQKILGNLTIIAKNAILNATEDFKQVTAASVPIKICCEIIVLPYDTVPAGIFEYINDKMEEKSDQVVMTNGVRSYCLYDQDDKKCDVYGTIPLKIEDSRVNVQSGKSMTYILCTSTPPTIFIPNTAASSLTINGTSTMKQAIIMPQDFSSVSDSISFTNLELQMGGKSPWNVKSMYIGSDVSFKGAGWNSFKFTVTETYNSSFDWYLNNLVLTTIFSVEFAPGSKIVIYDFNNIYGLFLGEEECFKVQYDDEDESKVVKFPNDNNRIVIYTNDSYFKLDVQGNPIPYGNFELHVLLLDDLKDILQVDFPSDWKYVTEVESGPIGLHVESLSRNNHIITMPFDQFPSNFVDFDEDKFTLYSTVNTTICLYNEGQDECTTVIGGQSLEIPSSGEITIEDGTQYIYSADEKVTIPENLVFKFDKNSAKAVGFDFAKYAKVKLVVTNEELELLSLKKVNFTCEFGSSSKELKVKKYENYYSSFELDGTFSVTESIAISVVEFREFEDKNYAFTGNFMNVIDPGLITEIEFTEDDWTIDIENGGKPFTIDEKGMTLKIESASKNVTFDVTEGAKTLTTLDFTSTASDSIIYFTTRWTDSSISIDSPVQLYNNVESLNVKFYHPFSYADSESAKKLVNFAPKIEDCPYQNASVCLSSDGTSDCSIIGFHLKAKAGQGSVYNVPSGYRFKLLIADDDLKVSYDSQSAKNISIEAYGKDVRPVKLTISDKTSTDALLLMNDLEVTFETSLSSIDWKLSSLDLFDTTFVSPVTAKLAVSGNCSVEMDIFYKMTKEGDGVFSDGRLTVDGYMTLRDSNEEYLNEIQLSSDSWTLKTSVCEFAVKNSQFKYLVLGVNRPPEKTLRFIPLTLAQDLINGQVAGNLDINIEEEFLYLQIDNDWKKVKSVVGGKIDIRATHDKGISRFLYDNEVDPQLFFNFHSSVHAINNATCPICLLPSENYVSDCFNNQALDMLPIISSDKNFLLDESRSYIIYGSPDDAHDFNYRTDIEYSVSVIAANKVTIKMNNAPSNVDFYFDSLIDGDGGECDLIFEKSMTLKSLKFDDSVRITADVDNFKLTLSELTIDYKGFRRFFREPGIFSKTNSIEVNGFINIIDDGRYEIIQCGLNNWNLIGNQDAWNTTFERRGSNQRLKITTSNTKINISSSIPSESSENSILSISLEFEIASALFYIEPSIADIVSFIDGKCIITSDQSLSVYSPFSYLPTDFFTMEGSYQSYSFKPTEPASLCLYEEGKTPCSVEGTKPQAVKSNKPFKIRFATKCSLVLTNTDVSLLFGETSSNSIDIRCQSSGSQKLKASLSFSSSVKTEKLSVDLAASSVDLSFTDSNKALSFSSIKLTNSMLESNSDCSVTGEFVGQFSSLQKFTKQLTTGDSINLNGDADSFSSSVTGAGPTILIGQNTKVYLSNLGSIFYRFDYGYDASLSKNKVVFGTSNEDAKSNSFTFLNLPVTSKFDLDFKSGSSVFANWIGGTSDASLLPVFRYNFGGSSNSLTVSKSSSESTNWPQPKSTDSAQIQIKTELNELDLNVLSKSFLKFDQSAVKLSSDSLSNIGNINDACQNTEMKISLENGVKTVGVGSNKVQIADTAVPYSSTTIKKLTIVHRNTLNNLTVNRIDSSSTVADLTIQVNGGTSLCMAKGFASASKGKISIEKVDGSIQKATVYVLDSKKPSVLSCSDGVDVVIDSGGGGDDDDDSGSDKKKLKPGIIAAIVLLVVLVVVVICVLVVYYIRSRKVDMTNYDYIPPLLSNTDNKNVDL